MVPLPAHRPRAGRRDTSDNNGAAGTADIKMVLRNARRFEPDIFIWEGPEQDAVRVLEEASISGLIPPIFLTKTISWPADFGK